MILLITPATYAVILVLAIITCAVATVGHCQIHRYAELPTNIGDAKDAIEWTIHHCLSVNDCRKVNDLIDTFEARFEYHDLTKWVVAELREEVRDRITKMKMEEINIEYAKTVRS